MAVQPTDSTLRHGPRRPQEWDRKHLSMLTYPNPQTGLDCVVRVPARVDQIAAARPGDFYHVPHQTPVQQRLPPPVHLSSVPSPNNSFSHSYSQAHVPSSSASVASTSIATPSIARTGDIGRPRDVMHPAVNVSHNDMYITEARSRFQRPGALLSSSLLCSLTPTPSSHGTPSRQSLSLNGQSPSSAIRGCNFCANCGYRLIPNNSSSGSVSLFSLPKFCPDCGAALPIGQSVSPSAQRMEDLVSSNSLQMAANQQVLSPDVIKRTTLLMASIGNNGKQHPVVDWGINASSVPRKGQEVTPLASTVPSEHSIQPVDGSVKKRDAFRSSLFGAGSIHGDSNAWHDDVEGALRRKGKSALFNVSSHQLGQEIRPGGRLPTLASTPTI